MIRLKSRVFIVAAAVYLLTLQSCGPRVSSGERTAEYERSRRNAAWAHPVSLAGVPNCYRVSEDLYRSAQPSSEGMRSLAAFGIKTIINLRSFHSDIDEIGDAELDYVPIPMNAWHPDDEEIIEFLRTATGEERTPVLVHCNYGADRTGFMCALYRIAVCGWSREEALAEMTGGGFGFHAIWSNLERYIEDADIDAIQRKAGVTGASDSICFTPR